MVKQYIGSKQFYKYVFTIMAPVLLQNVITNFVSLLDNIMVGQVGTEAMSGVAIANQLTSTETGFLRQDEICFRK